MSNIFMDIKEKITVCPDCDGEGGHKEAVIDYNQGVWYRCEFCEGKGYMNILKKIYWTFMLWVSKQQDKHWLKRGN